MFEYRTIARTVVAGVLFAGCVGFVARYAVIAEVSAVNRANEGQPVKIEPLKPIQDGVEDAITKCKAKVTKFCDDNCGDDKKKECNDQGGKNCEDSGGKNPRGAVDGSSSASVTF